MASFRAEALFRVEHVGHPLLLSSVSDVDFMVDALLAGPVGSNLAQLYSLQRPLMPSGFPDHELLVGANGTLNAGVLAFYGRWELGYSGS